ncbi:unnamed protein product [Didymodactylos carnosus]|uniref:RlpA-like protein double-psi beta-barrel domain-containing protein n=1 Tax=Didymodactylos carnosus TaxID=1234261 RepID=A0A815V7E5_9BILA|nr:unnamed protein product [Didymodactylos carnosus]CAF1608856.1 unnamed protein product [Didymodactylos carnosus]CAF4383365.1 unnamed protein product [Didymodactylos carnosus]CAF4421673.1 unnamed protein product [Didymodactylos carnosus]
MILYTGQATYYNIEGGYTACVTLQNDNQFLVAMNAPQFDPYTSNGNPNRNSLCGKTVRINGPKGSVTAVVIDRCPSCQYGDLDLTPAAFQAIADLSQGRVSISWSWL